MVRLRFWAIVVVALVGLTGGPAAGFDDKPHTGFIDMVYKNASGYEAKYVVFIPHKYDSKEALPVILFLHGSGAVGNDGRKQIAGALAKAIRKDEKDFAFIAVFPQSHEGGWTAGSADGKRALAILDEVVSTYKADKQRTYLTGLSMGGEGTWSLAAARPERWSAIVPLCGGGDIKIAAKIKDIPCWCFHGDADKMIPAAESRKMIRALWQAGGRPLYHEFPDVGHDCWDRVYAMPGVYEWLLLQKLK
ncbi:MAG TPA: dienelactone hydrolase family protein [Gemmataceae bacterium]|jgi:predicted peptidase|nr:dienelactone hydrolase family protein [Gemmataceae bacterium]